MAKREAQVNEDKLRTPVKNWNEKGVSELADRKDQPQQMSGRYKSQSRIRDSQPFMSRVYG